MSLSEQNSSQNHTEMISSSSLIASPYQKSVIKFFRSFELPQVVCLKINQSKIYVNSVILALHSPVFEEIILEGNDEITLESSLHYPGAEPSIQLCLQFIHGDEVKISLDQIPILYHFASVYKIKSMEEQCVECFMEYVQHINVYITALKNWTSKEATASDWYKKIVLGNSHQVIKCLTSNQSIPVVLNLIRDVNSCGSSMIPLMMPSQEMINDFLMIMRKKVTLPLDAVQLNLMKSKYCSGAKVSPMHSADVLRIEENSKELADEKYLHNTNLENIESSHREAIEVEASATHECNELASTASATCSREKNSEFFNSKNFSKLVTEDKNRQNLLSLSFSDILVLAQTIERNTAPNYLKLDIIITWVLLKKFQLDDNLNKKLFSSFNNAAVSSEFLLDMKEVFSVSGNTNCPTTNSRDKTYSVSSKIMTQEEIRKQIKENGSINLSDQICNVSSCQIDNHRLNFKVLLKKNMNDLCRVLSNDDVHSDMIVHIYLLALDESLFVHGIISLKVLTKGEIMRICNQYHNFVVKVIYMNPTCFPKLTQQDDEGKEKVMGFKDVFLCRAWMRFPFDELTKFIRNSYCPLQMNELKRFDVLSSRSDFIYLGIDIFFSLVLLGKLSLQKQLYQSFICSFDHSFISAEFMKDVKTVFNSVLKEPVSVVSKSGNKKSTLVAINLARDCIKKTMSHNGIICTGVFGCQVASCQIKEHTLNIQIFLNKSKSDLNVNVRSLTSSNIHKRKIQHFYLLALNAKEEPSQLISLKLLSKSEILQSLKNYQKFKLCIIFSK